MSQQMKKFVESQVCFYQVYTRRFSKIVSFGPKSSRRASRKYVFIKCTQGDFKKCITWPKKIGRKR